MLCRSVLLVFGTFNMGHSLDENGGFPRLIQTALEPMRQTLRPCRPLPQSLTAQGSQTQLPMRLHKTCRASLGVLLQTPFFGYGLERLNQKKKTYQLGSPISRHSHIAPLPFVVDFQRKRGTKETNVVDSNRNPRPNPHPAQAAPRLNTVALLHQALDPGGQNTKWLWESKIGQPQHGLPW